jgi:hypothetical protein
MKKLLLVSVSALFAAAPMLAHADPTHYTAGEGVSVPTTSVVAPYALAESAQGDTTNVVTASYVKGAYNDAIKAINNVASANATDAGNGLTKSNGTFSANLTNNGGLQLDGTTDGSKTLGVNVDGETIKKDSSTGALNVQYDNSTIVKDATSKNLKVGTITNDNITDGSINQAKINGLGDALAAKQIQLKDGSAANANNVSNVVQTTVRSAADITTAGVGDTTLVSEKAVRTAIDNATSANGGMVTLNGTQILTNKTIDADDNTISDLMVSDFKANVVNTTVNRTANALDSKLVTEKAVATAIDSSTVTVTAYTQWGQTSDPTEITGVTFNPGTAATGTNTAPTSRS